MARWIEHSDDWDNFPPVPSYVYDGWYISNNDGEPQEGPFKTREEAIEVFEEMEGE